MCIAPAAPLSESIMKTSAVFALFPLAILAACGTPQENCIRNSTREIRTLDRLIAESDANLARGYRFEETPIIRHEWVICGPRQLGAPPEMCLESVEDTVRRPVAIDPAIETRKRDNLRGKRAALMKPAETAIAACRAAYPEDKPAP